MSQSVSIKNPEIEVIERESSPSAQAKAESDLIERARGEPEAFGELYDLYYGRILSYIYRRILDIDTAEDLTSSTFFHALNALPRYRHRTSFRAWLYRIATNEVRMHHRSARNRGDREHAYYDRNDLDRVCFASPDIEKEEERETRLRSFARIHASLLSLPEKYRTVLVLRYFEELSLKEISLVTNNRVSTVKSLIHRGLKRLRSFMERDDATLLESLHYQE